MLKKAPDDNQSETAPAGSGDAGMPAKRRIGGRFRQSVARGLSGRLLLLTIIFVMIAEVLIFVPSVANFRNVWLQNHLDTANPPPSSISTRPTPCCRSRPRRTC